MTSQSTIEPELSMEDRWRAIDTTDAQGPVTGVTPHLSVSDGPAAIDFYRRAFAAQEVHRLLADDGRRIMHGCLRINDGYVMLADQFPEFCGGAPAGEPAGVTMHLQVDDADRWAERAVQAGATATMPVADMFWGDRYGQVRDPFGHTWSIGARIKTS